MGAGAAKGGRGYVPAHIGPYPILKRIGAGGFGEVFLAHHVTPDRRPVVVKRARPERVADERFAALFVQEACVVARLQHEHIVPVIGAGEDHGVPYLVMEYVRGPNLAQLLRTLPGERLAHELVAHVVVAIARALAHAHAAAVVHRDVKPQNVLIDSSGHVFLSDFGVARVQRGGPYQATLTATEAGTESYMAPEILGADTPLFAIDHRIDLWPLGVLAWECLCGFRPFEDEALGARPDLQAGQWAKLNVLRTPPRRRSIYDVMPDAPRALCDVIEGLLQPLEQRIATADDVVRRLGAFADRAYQGALAELVARDTAPSGSGIRPSMPGARPEELPMHDEPPPRLAEAPTARSSPGMFVLSEGARVGPYVVERQLGRGGMGATYLAKRSDVEKRVCLKVILPEFAADPRFRSDFLREAKIAGTVSHPNVVSLIDFPELDADQLDNDLLWAAFEFVSGVDLATLVQKMGGALPPDYVALIILDAAQGLLNLHMGDHHRPPIVHRDVSRNNIMVSFDGVAKVIDLGIAKPLHGGDTRNDPAGKWAYMAPEVLRGERPEPPVDQWALGVVLYSVLTGRAPYAGAYDGSRPPPLTSPHGPLDPRWQRIVDRLLEPDASRRYPSLDEMIDELAPLVPPPAMRRQLGHLLRLRAPSKSMEERPGLGSASEAQVAPLRPTIDVNELEPGSRFGEWEIARKLGTGGMAVVFLATRMRAVGGSQRAALKLIRPEHVASKDFVTRFEHEVEIALRLNHQNIVTILDAGKVHGVYFMAMEYVEGCDLDTMVESLTERGVLTRRRLPPECVLFVGAGLLHALEYAHAKGVVHRDVSPHNIMVTADGAVKLNDFGVAKSMKADGMISKTTHAIGKPFYMPPEQFRGDPLDGRADLFAAGASLYELLCGASPFAIRGTPDEMIHMVVQRVFSNDRPHTSEVAPHAPPELIEVLEGLLQPSRDDRPANAEAVLARLEPLVQLRTKRTLGELVRLAKDERAVPSSPLLEAVQLPPSVAAPSATGTLRLPIESDARTPASPASSVSTPAQAAPAASRRGPLLVTLAAISLAVVALSVAVAVVLVPRSTQRPDTPRTTQTRSETPARADAPAPLDSERPARSATTESPDQPPQLEGSERREATLVEAPLAQQSTPSAPEPAVVQVTPDPQQSRAPSQAREGNRQSRAMPPPLRQPRSFPITPVTPTTSPTGARDRAPRPREGTFGL